MMPADLHPRDIDPVQAEDRANPADDTRNIAVMGDYHLAGKRPVEREPVDFDDSRVLAVPGNAHVMRRFPGRLE